jgi:hypothetical protein
MKLMCQEVQHGIMGRAAEVICKCSSLIDDPC